ncbi:MAG: hypothetical protein HC822_08175 [Oscillochloris sp.]|nr:hypothetical protein [Oscillochloris sp.]
MSTLMTIVLLIGSIHLICAVVLYLIAEWELHNDHGGCSNAEISPEPY